MKVFVAGGTGAVGGRAVPALVQQGHTVTALARTRNKAATLTAQGATPLSVSLFAPPALAAAFAGHGAVVNLATAIPPMTRWLGATACQRNDRVRSQGSAAVVDAALAAGVGRLVQESVAMLYRDQGARWVDEDAPLDRYPMARANLAAEANAGRFSPAGGRGVVLRLGWFCGPGAAHSEQPLALARRHLGLVLGPPEGYVPSVQVADVAAAVAAALRAPAGRFDVVDDEPLPKRGYAQALARAAGTAMWLGGPGRAGLLLGDRLTSLARSLRVSNARLRAATGRAPRYASAREGWIATATALKHSRIVEGTRADGR
jgi:nucleoside-diphosphate-sugar epimerase